MGASGGCWVGRCGVGLWPRWNTWYSAPWLIQQRRTHKVTHFGARVLQMSAEKVAARGAARTGAAGAKGLQGLAPPLIIERQMSLTAFVERAARDFLQFSLALPMRIRTPPGDYAHPPPAAQLPPISIAAPPHSQPVEISCRLIIQVAQSTAECNPRNTSAPLAAQCQRPADFKANVFAPSIGHRTEKGAKFWKFNFWKFSFLEI